MQLHFQFKKVSGSSLILIGGIPVTDFDLGLLPQIDEVKDALALDSFSIFSYYVGEHETPMSSKYPHAKEHHWLSGLGLHPSREL